MAIQFRQTGCLVEYSEDNGTTWHVAADLSQCAQIIAPTVPGEALRCSVAALLTENLQDMQTKMISNKQASASGFATGNDILAVLIGVGAFITKGVALAIVGLVAEAFARLGDAGSQDLTNFANALDSDFYEYAKCKLSCMLPSDGTFTNRVLQEWAAEIRAFDTNNPAYGVVSDYVSQFPLNSWQQLANLAIARRYPGDCSLCECAPRCQPLDSSGNPINQNVDGTYTITGQNIVPTGTPFYVGGFGLSYPTYNCKLESVEAVGTFTYTTSPISFAVITISDSSNAINFVAPQTLDELVGECFNTVIFQSTEAFEIKVRVTACEGEDEWCCEFDFANGQQSWYPAKVNTTCNAVSGAFSAGAWHPTMAVDGAGRHFYALSVQRAFNATITHVEVHYDRQAGQYTETDIAVRLSESGTVNGRGTDIETIAAPGVSNVDLIYEWDGSRSVPGITVELRTSGRINVDPNPIGSATLKKVIIRGTGLNPFGSSNCT